MMGGQAADLLVQHPVKLWKFGSRRALRRDAFNIGLLAAQTPGPRRADSEGGT